MRAIKCLLWSKSDRIKSNNYKHLFISLYFAQKRDRYIQDTEQWPIPPSSMWNETSERRYMEHLNKYNT